MIVIIGYGYNIKKLLQYLDIVGVVFFKSCFDLSFSDPPGARTLVLISSMLTTTYWHSIHKTVHKTVYQSSQLFVHIEHKGSVKNQKKKL